MKKQTKELKQLRKSLLKLKAELKRKGFDIKISKIGKRFEIAKPSLRYIG